MCSVSYPCAATKKSATINDSGLGAGTRPTLYDLCSKYRSGVYAFLHKKAVADNARHGELSKLFP